MLDQEKKYQRQALIGTVTFHTLLLILLSLPFMSLTYQDPPLSKNKGISIDFSSDNSQSINLSNDQESIANVKVEDIQTEVEDIQTEVEDIQTEVEDIQTEVEDVQIEVEKEQIETLDPSLESILKKGEESMNSQNESGNRNNGGNNKKYDGESNTNGESNTDGESNTNGGNSGSKNSLIDITRTPDDIPTLRGNGNETGSVIVKITVNPEGSVILAQIVPSHIYKNQKFISSNDPILRKNALEAANEITFKEKTSIDDDIGYVVFTFEAN